MKIVSLLVAVIVARESYGAALLPPANSEVCLCLGLNHCFTINGILEKNNLVTPLTDEVNIHLPLSAFTVESLDTCAARQKRDTSIGAHGSDHGVGVDVDHQSGNTHAHGSVDVDNHGHVSGSGSISHQSGNTNTHGSVNVDSHGHVSGSAGIDHQSGNVHTSGGVGVDEHGHVSGHISVGIDFGRK